MPDRYACRTSEQLKQFVRRALPLADVEAISRHIESCRNCADAVEQIVSREPQTAGAPAGLDTIALPGALDFGPSVPAGYQELPIVGVEHGRFAILQSHAQGGLGEVFLALDQQMNREVALKQIQADYARDPDSRQRFLLEAEITGRLEHPGIVPVYARGHYEDGRLYYAMRFIHGESLKEAIGRFHQADEVPSRDPGERALSLRKLLVRFNEVCNAIAYAHSRGVVHRDIKPTNIMLGPYGETLVVDWGLAKILEAPVEQARPADGSLPPLRSGSSSSTQMGVAVGTPAYMSPEQAMGRQPQVGPASDIYSLGATLYELLTGHQPYGEDRTGNLQDLLKQVMAGRVTPPRKRNPRVPPPLEAICLKAMAVERDQRYATARDLADDVEAWLADEPVRAWAEPWTVRLSRWRRRNRPLVTGLTTAAAALLISLTLGIGLLLSANQRIGAERDRAERNFKQLRVASNGMMEVIKEWLSRSPERTSVQKRLLSKGLELYEQFFEEDPNHPAVRAEIAANHQRVADIYRLLGNFEPAAEHSRLAQAEFQALAAAEGQEIAHRRGWAESSNWLGEARRLAGQPSEARQAYAEAIRIGGQLRQERPRDAALAGELARAHYNLGLLLHSGGETSEAEQNFRTAIGLSDEAVSIDAADEKHQQHLARCHINLGILMKNTSRPLEADQEYVQAIKLLQRLAQEASDNPEFRSELAIAQKDRGNLLYSRHNDARLADGEPLTGALAAFNAAIDLLAPLSTEYANVPSYRHELAGSYNGLGSAHLLQNELAKARQAWQKAREQQEALVAASPKLADYHSALGLTLGNLALIARREDDAAHARRLLEDAIQHQGDAVRMAKDNISYLRFLNNHRQSLARLHLAQGEHALGVEQADQVALLSPPDWQESLRVAELIARCLGAAQVDSTLDDAARQRVSDDYGRRAVTWLERAAQSGLKDVAPLEADPDFQPLRGRGDYQDLVSRLKTAAKP